VIKHIVLFLSWLNSFNIFNTFLLLSIKESDMMLLLILSRFSSSLFLSKIFVLVNIALISKINNLCEGFFKSS